MTIAKYSKETLLTTMNVGKLSVSGSTNRLAISYGTFLAGDNDVIR